MIPKQAIEKAIDGGWKKDDLERCTIAFYEPKGCNGGSCYIIDFTYNSPETGERKGLKYHFTQWQIALDPTFWQALGKALKFDQPIWKCGNARCDNEFCEYAGWKNLAPDTIYGEVHKFLDLILTGGDTEKFWEEILK